MPTLLHTLRLLSIVVWVGGIVFFAFVLAPVAFRLLPSQHEAGIVVGGTLLIFEQIGLACGGVFLLATAILSRQDRRRRRGFQILVVFIMTSATGYLYGIVLPAMERDRVSAGGNIGAVSIANPAHIHFERLHKRSEQVEGAVLFCGLGVVLLMARESLPSKALDL